jgi:branched-chain amino acid transport system substrate-binding protein
MLGFSKVAVDIFNEETGLNVEFVQGDTEINADVGKIVAEQFVADEDIVVVVGPAGSQVCESTQPVFEGAGLAHVTPTCTATFLTDPGAPTFFRPIATDAFQSRDVANVMINTIGAQSVFMVDDQSTYAVNLNDELETLMADAGVEVTDRVSVSQEETDMSSIATAAIADGADVVFFPSQAPAQIGTLIAQLREQGYEGTIFLPDGGFSPEVISTAGDAAEGTYVTSFAADPNQVESMAPYNEAFTAEFTEEFGSFGGATAMSTFVALASGRRTYQDRVLLTHWSTRTWPPRRWRFPSRLALVIRTRMHPLLCSRSRMAPSYS